MTQNPLNQVECQHALGSLKIGSLKTN